MGWKRTGIVLAACILAPPAGAGAESLPPPAVARAGGLRLEVPGSWAPLSGGTGDPRLEGRAWGREAGGRLRSSLVVASCPGGPWASPAGWSGGAARAIEEAVRGAPGIDRFRVLGARAVEIDGVRACEVHASLERCGEPLEQIHYIVPAREAVLLVFTAPREGFERARAELREIASAARVEEPLGLLDEAPPWLCGAFLLGLSALGAAGKTAVLRRARSRKNWALVSAASAR
ncbi:MAG: hypothetical protein HY721_14345 [Planctomycetes bacterium]|nr:hypothetical protein [Planctomycetota bacterium]